MHEVIKELSPLERKALPYLEKYTSFKDLCRYSRMKEVELMRALQWLQNKEIVKIKENVTEQIDLDENGKKYLKIGLPEKRFLRNTGNETPITAIQTDAELTKEELNVCLGVLRSKVAVQIKKNQHGLVVSITNQGKKLLEKESFEEQFLKKTFPLGKAELKDEEIFAYDNLRKRKGIVKTSLIKEKFIELTSLGKEVVKESVDSKFIESLTPELLKSGKWKNHEFRHYDVKINVPKIYGGKKHFVNQAIDYIKKIWLEMGFEEMKGNIVQTAFWDLDALFVPQDHPAREEQDTFYIKDPAEGKLPGELKEKIKRVHEDGYTTGSKGWQEKWSEKVAKENLLRTHTTVLSAQTIARLKKAELPAKFFSVGRVYRNEAVDAKHLFELTQVEGIVVDPDANFKHLIGYLKEFFKKMGYKDARVRPGHFPYTEPSAEVDVFDPVRKEWIELGGSGIFRPEVTKPLMGFECPVLAWGLGMERTIAEHWKIKDIRELYKNDLKQIREMRYWMR